MRRLRERRDEAGATLILFAIAAVALFGMAAMSLDLSLRRTDRRVNKSVADFATAAGASRLEISPWAGVCEARDYLLANAKEFSSFTTQEWRNGAGALLSTTASGPCTGTTSAPFTTRCNPATPSTWARFRGTTAGGRITVRIESAYALPDASFPEDSVPAGDDGSPCEQVAVIVSESRTPGFAGVFPGQGGARTTRVRSVGRIVPGGPGDEPASLVLLERHDCRAARTQGSDTRIIVASIPASGSTPAASGVIQADSLGDGSCPGGQRILEGAATSGGPAIVARHARDPLNFATIQKEARIGIYGKLFGAPQSHTAWPASIGEPDPTGFRQVGRGAADASFLENVRQLETDATTMVNRTTLPPGFTNASGTPGLNLGCTINNPTPVTGASKLWFNCPGGLVVNNLTINSADAEIVINGPLEINAPGFTVRDVQKLWVKGKSTGNNRGIQMGSGAQFIVNNDGFATCPARFASSPTARTNVNTLFLKEGTFLAGQTTLRLCQTHVYLRGARAAATPSYLPGAVTPPPNLPPEPANNNSLGSINVGANSVVDWTAPNELDLRPTAAELAVHKFEDLALWTEASDTSVLNGGGGMNLSGIYFLPNANPFTITGNAGQSITLDAQFFVRKLDVTGNSTLTMTPNPENQLPVSGTIVALVR